MFIPTTINALIDQSNATYEAMELAKKNHDHRAVQVLRTLHENLVDTIYEGVDIPEDTYQDQTQVEYQDNEPWITSL